MNRRADYGLDAPGLVQSFLAGGALLILAGIAATSLGAPPHRFAGLGMAMLWMGGSFAISGAMMVASSRVGKLRARDALLDRAALAPDARVLDIGCGRGLMLIGAAKRATRGRAVGIDLWSQKDQGANSREATLANAVAENVADRVDVHDGDMRQLPFSDASFDAVVSSLAIHNVASRDDRRRAIAEIARVVRPGGTIAIMDIAHVGEYADDLRAAGARSVTMLGLTPYIFPPTRSLIATR